MAKIEDEIKSKFQSERQKFIINLMFTSNWIKNNHSELLRPYNITSQQYNILRILRGNGDFMSMNTVKERMIDKSPNTTRLVDKLIEKNFVERKRCDEDRRVVYAKIHQKGLDMLKELDEKSEKPFLEMLDTISDKEAKQVSDILDKLRG